LALLIGVPLPLVHFAADLTTATFSGDVVILLFSLVESGKLT
jgi:hypothetical protein